MVTYSVSPFRLRLIFSGKGRGLPLGLNPVEFSTSVFLAFPSFITLGSTVTNTIVYYNKLLVSEYLVIYQFDGKARVYVADKSLQPSLMFVGKP